jgi:hypothetical protein
MAYSDEQRVKVVEWFEQHLTRCASCGRQRPPLGASPVPGRDARFEFRDLVVCAPYAEGDHGFAAIPIYCKDCGYVVFVAAEVIGLIDHAIRRRTGKTRIRR